VCGAGSDRVERVQRPQPQSLRPRSGSVLHASYGIPLPFEALFAARDALFGPILMTQAGEHAR
jgi:hypothetical protein